MMKKSPFAIHKALIGIGGEPKSVKRLRSGDLLIETSSALQTKYFLLAKFFLDSSLTISPHKSLNTSCGVISEPDLLSTSEAEILDGFSDQGVIQIIFNPTPTLVIYLFNSNYCVSEPQPPIPKSNDASLQSYPLPHPTPVFNHPRHLLQYLI
ncbi:uncharacterized protein TNCV_775991 [Trichonephila clavipes]|nr:uncharacterized protein TNCV_775991 [Trichonephila clavipes]